METFSFYNYLEYRQAGTAVKSAMAGAKVPDWVLIGGFTPGSSPKSLFEATKNIKAKLSRIEVVFDDEDIKYLYQFPYEQWAEALHWRYNEGIANWCFGGQLTGQYNANPNFEHIFEKLTRLGYDMPRFKAKTQGSEGWMLDQKTGLFNTQNYQSIQIPAMKVNILDWIGGINRGFLNATGDYAFLAEEGKGAGQKKAGRPWKTNNILVSPQGLVMTQGKRLIKAAPANFLKRMGLSPDKSGMVTYPGRSARIVPTLTRGQMFRGSVVTDAQDAENRIGRWFNENALHRIETDGDFAGRLIITPEEFKKLGMPEDIQQLYETAVSKIEIAQTQTAKVTPEELIDIQRERGRGLRGINVAGGINPVYNTPMEIPTGDTAIKDMGKGLGINLHRGHFDSIVDTFFVEDPAWDIDSLDEKTALSPKGVVESPVVKGIKNGKYYLYQNRNDSWRPGTDGYPPDFIEDMLQTKEPMLMKEFKDKKLQHTISGTDRVQNFINLFLQKTNAKLPATGEASTMRSVIHKLVNDLEPEDRKTLQKAWTLAAETIRTHATRFANRSYQAEAEDRKLRQKTTRLKSRKAGEVGFARGEEGEEVIPVGVSGGASETGRKEHDRPIRNIRGVRGVSIPIGKVFLDIGKTVEKQQQLRQLQASGTESPRQLQVKQAEISQEIQAHDTAITDFVHRLTQLKTDAAAGDEDTQKELALNIRHLKAIALGAKGKQAMLAKKMAEKAGISDAEWDAA